MKDLKLNYFELAFVMGIPTSESKAIFERELSVLSVKKSDLINVEDLSKYFGMSTSVDDRFHKRNKLYLTIELCKNRYKNYLSDISCIKKKSFTGGKTIFNKILDAETLDFCKDRFEEKFKYLGLDKRNK